MSFIGGCAFLVIIVLSLISVLLAPGVTHYVITKKEAELDKEIVELKS
jgi:hypothetical protein